MPNVDRNYVINTYPYTFTHTALDCMRHLADRGFPGFELMMFPGHLWPSHASRAERQEIARFLRSSGTSIRTLNQPNIDINIGAAVAEMREYSISAIERIFLLACDLNCPGVIIGAGKPNPLLPASDADMQDRFFAALDRFVPLAEKLGVQVLLENMPFSYLPAAKDMMAALDAFGADSVGVVYDLANGAFIGEDIGAGLDAVAARLRFVHLSDTPSHACRHDPIEGNGIVQFAAAAKSLGRIGHKETPIIEIVSANPDSDIDSSIGHLHRAGWPA